MLIYDHSQRHIKGCKIHILLTIYICENDGCKNEIFVFFLVSLEEPVSIIDYILCACACVNTCVKKESFSPSCVIQGTRPTRTFFLLFDGGFKYLSPISVWCVFFSIKKYSLQKKTYFLRVILRGFTLNTAIFLYLDPKFIIPSNNFHDC